MHALTLESAAVLNCHISSFIIKISITFLSFGRINLRHVCLLVNLLWWLAWTTRERNKKHANVGECCGELLLLVSLTPIKNINSMILRRPSAYNSDKQTEANGLDTLSHCQMCFSVIIIKGVWNLVKAQLICNTRQAGTSHNKTYQAWRKLFTQQHVKHSGTKLKNPLYPYMSPTWRESCSWTEKGRGN